MRPVDIGGSDRRAVGGAIVSGGSDESQFGGVGTPGGGILGAGRQAHRHPACARIIAQRASRAASRLKSTRVSQPVRPRSAARTKTVGLPACSKVASISPKPDTVSRSRGRPLGSNAASPPGSRKSRTISAPGKATPAKLKSPSSTG